MRIVEVRNEADLPGLRSGWQELLARSASDTIFLTWEWAIAWWTAYGIPGDLRVLLVFDENDTLRGIAPLRQQTISRYGHTYEALAFLGDGSSDSDYLDFIIGVGDESVVMQTFFDYLRKDFAKGLLLQLNGIPESSPNLRFVRALGRQNGMICAEEDVACATVRLPGDWQEYLKKLAPRFRTKVRSVLRNLEGQPDIRFRLCERPSELDRLLPGLFELHRRRWVKEAKPGVFHWDRKRRFYETLSPLLLDRGWLRFSLLEWKDQLLASQYGFSYRTRYYQLQEGFDPTCEHWNVGIGLRSWSIRKFMEEGVCEYDFMAGVGRHKSDWGAEIKLSKRIVLGSAHPKNILFCCGPQWVTRVRQSVKKHVPPRLLAARDARQERNRIAAFMLSTSGTGATSSVAPFIRSALASFYFHSPFPKLLKTVRNHFQLCLQRNGTAPKMEWHRRTKPSARILYFHRINDEDDPFFPAMSTKQFEEQMRYVAGHYHVISLGEVVNRIRNGGPAEPAIAITFDDGYQDNYLNAFPILQRYGLPATIFLTTGSLDSREPLWFEKLALALKKTSRTSLDLELDVPRRIYMRDETERLKANGQIFSLLRSVPDTQRRQHLSDILMKLDGHNHSERNDKMLTWDQVRIMQKHAIEFGGHTVNHPFMSRLMPEQAFWELSECKRRIEEELQASVKHFAYPNGREEDFHSWNKQLLHKGGYDAAVSTLWGVNQPGTDPMELRRGGPWEETLALFAAKLDWYQWVDG